MTEPGKIEGLVDVTQADRDAAAAVHDRMARVVVAQAKMAGVSSTVAAFPQAHDDYWLTQAFAHFRTTALTALRDELEQVRGAIAMPTPAAIAAALPLTNEPDDDDWRIADEACEMLACVNTYGELAAAQLCRDYRNVADFLARAALSRDPKL